MMQGNRPDSRNQLTLEDQRLNQQMDRTMKWVKVPLIFRPFLRKRRRKHLQNRELVALKVKMCHRLLLLGGEENQALHPQRGFLILMMFLGVIEANLKIGNQL